jgi:hypothetical protein
LAIGFWCVFENARLFNTPAPALPRPRRLHHVQRAAQFHSPIGRDGQRGKSPCPILTTPDHSPHSPSPPSVQQAGNGHGWQQLTETNLGEFYLGFKHFLPFFCCPAPY